MTEPGKSNDSGRPVLFREFPELHSKIDRIPLGKFPTPVHPLEQLGFANLWIKRDDLSSPVYGGNKIRKLEFILAEARRRHARHLITFGGIGTNHGLATAIFCHRLGIKCTLLLFRQPVTEQVKQNVRLLKKFGAGIIYTRSLWNVVASYYLLSRIRYPRACFVYAGGSNPAGTVGFVNAAFELKAQIDRGDLPVPADLICPLGSGGTLAGLSLGLQLAGLETRAAGVRVTASHLGPFQVCTEKTVVKLMQQTYAYLKQRCRNLPDISLRAPAILHDYIGEGYGFSTPAGDSACRRVQETTGILLDPTYTAKTFAAVVDCCREPHSGPVLYWHTYNSVDLSAQADPVADRQLPEPLRTLIETPSQTPGSNP